MTKKEIIESLPREYLDMLKEVLKTAGTDKIYCDFDTTSDGTVIGNCYVLANCNSNSSRGRHLYNLGEDILVYDLLESNWYRSDEIHPSCIILCNDEKISERRDHAYIINKYECVRFKHANI